MEERRRDFGARDRISAFSPEIYVNCIENGKDSYFYSYGSVSIVIL